jgi:UDP-glucose-4-epimerase GalE
MQEILVVGGAGYIGSYMCKHLAGAGYLPVVLDNLATGHRAAVRYGPFFKGDLDDRALLEKIFHGHRIQAVMHFAAHCYVGESVTDPARYYRNNVAATLSLLESMRQAGVRHLIFSSSCAVYGEPLQVPMDETHPLRPINPYGRSKLMVEQMLEDFASAYGLAAVRLRYFNAAGADPEASLGEDHRPETHLIPLVLQVALGQRPAVEIFGDDFSTTDGTCIRDYIHIADLAQAHGLALVRLLDGASGGVFNLGNGNGYSVREVIETARRVTGKSIPARVVGRRDGDPSILVGSCRKARDELGWQPRFGSLESIVETAWRWHCGHPCGYDGQQIMEWKADHE